MLIEKKYMTVHILNNIVKFPSAVNFKKFQLTVEMTQDNEEKCVSLDQIWVYLSEVLICSRDDNDHDADVINVNNILRFNRYQRL